MSTTKPTLTRKDIAQMVDCSFRTVARKERAWGLDKARADWGGSRIRYKAPMVLLILRGRGLLG